MCMYTIYDVKFVYYMHVLFTFLLHFLPRSTPVFTELCIKFSYLSF